MEIMLNLLDLCLLLKVCFLDGSYSGSMNNRSR